MKNPLKRLAPLVTFAPAVAVTLVGAGCSDNNAPASQLQFVQGCDKGAPGKQGLACFDLLSDWEKTNSFTAGHNWGSTDAWAASGDNTLTPPTMPPYGKADLLDTPRSYPDPTNPSATVVSTRAWHSKDFGGHVQWGSAWLTPSGLNGSKAVDLSQYTGISFWAKSDGAYLQVKIALPDLGSMPTPADVTPLCDMNDNSVGGRGCYDDYSYKYSPDSVWRRYDIPFSQLTTGGWGLAHAFDPSKVYQIKFSMLQEQTYDEWIDDIGFYRE